MFKEVKSIEKLELLTQELEMSLIEPKTFDLWSTFMPQVAPLFKQKNTTLYSMEHYKDLSYFTSFNPATKFKKLAGVEVSALKQTIPSFKKTSLEGLYAIFLHRGTQAQMQATYQYILGVWLPSSNYDLDHRMFFCEMGENYQNNSPDSEELVYIPIRKKHHGSL